MSLYDYRISLEIAKKDYSFYALIMAAIRKADTVNLEKFKSAWPEIYRDFVQRYNAPGGLIENEE